MGIWYHGDISKRRSFQGQRMDRDQHVDPNAKGPGVYFTSDKRQAAGYASPNGYIYTCEIKTSKIVKDRTRIKPQLVRKMIELAPDTDMGLSNWGYGAEGETPIEREKALRRAIEAYVGFSDSLIDALLTIYGDFYGRSDANIWAANMVKIGIDAYEHKLSAVRHLIVYNTSKIKIIEEERFSMAVLGEGIKIMPRNVSQIGLAKFKKLVSLYDNSDAFDNANLKGFGALSSGDIVSYIVRQSRTRLNLSSVKAGILRSGNWFFLHQIDVNNVNASTHGKVTPTGDEDLSVPIVVDQNNNVLDGRHRVQLAKINGVRTLPAYIPAKTLYNLLSIRESMIEARQDKVILDALYTKPAKAKSWSFEFALQQVIRQTEGDRELSDNNDITQAALGVEYAYTTGRLPGGVHLKLRRMNGLETIKLIGQIAKQKLTQARVPEYLIKQLGESMTEAKKRKLTAPMIKALRAAKQRGIVAGGMDASFATHHKLWKAGLIDIKGAGADGISDKGTKALEDGFYMLEDIDVESVSSGGIRWVKSGLSNLENALSKSGVKFKYERDKILYSLDGKKWFEAKNKPSMASDARRAIDNHYSSFAKMLGEQSKESVDEAIDAVIAGDDPKEIIEHVVYSYYNQQYKPIYPYAPSVRTPHAGARPVEESVDEALKLKLNKVDVVVAAEKKHGKRAIYKWQVSDWEKFLRDNDVPEQKIKSLAHAAWGFAAS